MFAFITKTLDFINKYFKIFVLFIIVLVIFLPTDEPQKPANLAKLYLNMPLFESESFANEIKRIKDSKVKGVLLVINSPGGTVSASIEIADMIKDLREQMPVIAYVQGTMASGSYYAGMYANAIFANRGALIGSIGVIFSGLNVSELMDKLGIKEQGLKAGAYKEMGTITRAWSEKEREFMDNLIKEQYTMFYNDVLQARDSMLKSKDYEVFAEGKVFSAHTALELGLIDNIGSMQDATNELKKLTNIDEEVWLKKDKFETYINKILESASHFVISSLQPTLKMSQ